MSKRSCSLKDSCLKFSLYLYRGIVYPLLRVITPSKLYRWFIRTFSTRHISLELYSFTCAIDDM